MASNYVEILVKARDGAKPDLDALKAKLEELKGTVAEARAKVDDADAASKLDKLAAQLDTLDHRTANPKITLAGALRAEAQIHAVEASLNHLADTTAPEAGARAGAGFMSRFGAFLKPSVFKLISAGVVTGLAVLPAAAGAAGAAAGILLAAKFLIGTKQVQGPLYGAFHSMLAGLKSVISQAVMPMLGPLKQAFTSIGAFAKQIEPVLHQVFGALGKLVMPLTRGLEGLVRGILPGFLALMKASGPAVKVLAGLLSGLGRDLGGMLKALAPAIRASAGVLKELVSIVSGLFPVIGKVAAAIAPAFGVLARVLAQVFHVIEKSGVLGILENALVKLAGPLGTVISKLVTGLAPVLPVVVGAIGKVAGAITVGLVNAVVQLLPSLVQLIGTAGKFLVALTPLIPSLVQLDLAMISLLLALTPLLPPLIKIIDKGLELLIKVIVPLAPKIAQVITKMAELTAGIAKVISKVVGIIAKGLDWVSNAGKVGQAVGKLKDAVVRFFEDMWHGAVSRLDNLISFVKKLPGKILAGLSNLASMLFKAGVKAVEGLLNGMESMIGHAKSLVGGWGHDIASAIVSPFGIHMSEPSEATQMIKAGLRIPQGLGAGIDQGTTGLRAAARRMSSLVNPGGPPGSAPGGGPGGPVVVKLEFSAGGSAMDHVLTEWLRNNVRVVGGGNVQKAYGQAGH